MVTKLTPKQKEVLDTIQRLTEAEGRAPTLRRLQQELDLGQISSVQRHVEALRLKGALPAARPWQRGIEISHSGLKQIPLVGCVACGVPILAEENVEAHIPYSTTKLKSKTATYFFLRARGDSMDLAKPTPIAEGDLLLVKQEPTARNNDIVVALIGDEATCKVIEKTSDGWFRLSPRSHNLTYKPRVMLEDFSILGVVEDVIKSPRNG